MFPLLVNSAFPAGAEVFASIVGLHRELLSHFCVAISSATYALSTKLPTTELSVCHIADEHRNKSVGGACPFFVYILQIPSACFYAFGFFSWPETCSTKPDTNLELMQRAVSRVDVFLGPSTDLTQPFINLAIASTETFPMGHSSVTR